MSSRVPIAAAGFLALGLGLTTAFLDAAAQFGSLDTLATVARTETADSTVRRPASTDVPLADVIRTDDRAFGRSGTLRLAVVTVLEAMEASFVLRTQGIEEITYRWEPLFGTRPEVLGGEVRLSAGLVAPSQPGYWRLVIRRHGEQHEVNDLTVVTKVPFDHKRNGRLNGYMIGTYATEGSGRTDHYAPPAGFIEVTPETRDVSISKHLRVGQFLTKDQFEVWPKYVALDLRLIDKLELVMQELHAMGVRAERMHIMSGFRTPNYNGPGEGGRALLSRHTYGDAADVWIENGSRGGYIADLNGDGRQDLRDAEVIVQAVERVEQKYPELAGGVGLYRENGARGPFVHIDVRGNRSRW